MRISRIITASIIAGLILATALIPGESSCYGQDTRPDDDSWVEQTLSRLTLREKIGQLITVSYSGNFINRDSNAYRRLVEEIGELKVGGYILYGGTVAETAKLTNAMQAMSDVPLLIASDLERGLGNQLSDAVHFPFNMTFGAAGSEELAYEHGRITAVEARAAGIHQVYGPVVDVNNNPDNPIINVRAYGGTPELVTRIANAFIRGAQDHGLIATAKHFPGHGDTGTDTHSRLAVIEVDEDRLNAVELAPFKAAVETGVRSVMTAHISVPAVDPAGVPATMSDSILEGILREKFGFDGIIVTDAMGMGGIVNDYSIVDGSIEAIRAGSDILLAPLDPKMAIEGIAAAVGRGDLSKERIDESVRRILEAKQWLGLPENRFVDTDELNQTVGLPENHRVAREVAERSITLLRNENGIVPLDDSGDKQTLIMTATSDFSSSLGTTFRRTLSSLLPNSETAFIDPRTNDLEMEEILEQARAADRIVCGTFVQIRARKDFIALAPEQEAYFQQILDLGKPVVVAAFGNPYVIRQFPDVDAYLCTFNYLSSSEVPAARALAGLAPVTGTLPIAIPGFFEPGSGIIIPNEAIADDEDDFPVLTGGDPYDAGFTRDFSERLTAVLQGGVDRQVAPAIVCAVGRRGRIVFQEAFGSMTYDPGAEPVTLESMFDLASLTKVTATTTLAMIYYDRGLLDLDAPVSKYLPELKEGGRFTVRHCLAHSTGFPAFLRFYDQYSGREEIQRQIFKTGLIYEPGTKTVYSDIGMMTLATVLERISGKQLDEMAETEVFGPLGMSSTMYNPGIDLLDRTVPTEECAWRGELVRGAVHDENAFAYGGVSGHAGLFSTVGDLSVFARMILNGGGYGDTRLISRSTIDLFTRHANVVPGSSRGLGWGMFTTGTSGGRYLSDRAIGHTGFTGTSIWIDPEKDLFVVLLTNRVHPTRDNQKINSFRQLVHNTICEAIRR